MKIYVIRHGETDWNVERRLQGQADIPLNDFGRKLAVLTGEGMRGIKFDACISSPLSRAYETARLVLDNSGNEDVEFQKEPRIMEIYCGTREGEVAGALSKEVQVDIDEATFGGETRRQVMERSQPVLRELALKDYENVLVSTHGCALRCMLNFLYEDPTDFWQGVLPVNCAVSIVEAGPDGMRILESDKVYYDKKYIVDHYTA